MCLNNLLNFAVFTSGRATEIKSFLTLWQMQAVHKVADFMQTDTYRNTFNPSKLSITLLEHAGLDSFPMHYPSSGNKGIVPVPAIEFLADTITDVCSEPAHPVRERDQEIFKTVVDVIKDCVPAVTSVCGVTPEQLVACVQCIGGRLSAVVGTNIAQANLYTLRGRPTPLCMNATRGFLLLLPGPVTHFLSLSKREPDGTYLLQDPRYAASVQLSAEDLVHLGPRPAFRLGGPQGPGRHPKARPYRNPNPSSASYAPGRPYVAPRYPRYPALGRPVTGGTLPGLGGRESRLIPAATAAAPRRQTGDQREACAERFWRVSAILLSEGQLEFSDPVVLPCNENPKQPGCERQNSVSSTAAKDSRDEVACPPITQMHA
eukprot:COSAG01_NODE_9205_length_2520_cov_212.160677_3_plen_375_part_00